MTQLFSDFLDRELRDRINFYSLELNRYISDEISLLPSIIKAVQQSLVTGGTIFCAGNGGSMADSLHFTAELIGRFEKERNSLPAISLGANLSSLTAIANDYKFTNVFSRELSALASNRDSVILLSTSGNSENILLAAKTAHSIGCSAFGFTGEKPSKLSGLLPTIRVGSNRTAFVQEIHGILLHIICSAIDL